MTIQAEARIIVRGGSEALRTVRGVSRESTKATQESKKAAAEEAKAAKAAAAATEKAHRAKARAAQATERETKRLARAEAREQDRLAQHYGRVAQRAADYRIRQEARVTSAAQREAAKRLRDAQNAARKQERVDKETAEKRKRAAEDSARRGRGFLGAATGGVIAGAVGASSTARGIGGIRSMPERIQAANEFRERLTIVGSQAELSGDEKARVEGQINSAAKSSGKDQGELLSVLEVGQAKFNDLRFFADNLQEIATIARATGSDAGEFAQAVGYTRQAFGLSGEEAMEAARLMVAAASKGSIEVKDFASSFAPVAGLFAQSTGMTGLAGVRQFLGTSQAAGTLGKSADETATLVERFIAAIADPEVSKDLKAQTGLSIKGMTPQQIIESLANNKKFGKPGVKQEVFKDVREQQAVTALIAAYRRAESRQEGAVDIGTIGAVDAKTGQAAIAKTMGELEGSGALAFDRKNAELQEHTLNNLAKYNDQLMSVLNISTRLETSFDSLSLWADAIAATGIGAAAGGMLAGGGGGASGGGLMSGLGNAVSKFGVPGAILGGGMLAAGAIYESGAGEWIGNKLYDLFNDDPEGVVRAGTPEAQAMMASQATRPSVTPMAPTAARPGAGPLSNRAIDQIERNTADTKRALIEMRDLMRTRPAPFLDYETRSGARP